MFKKEFLITPTSGMSQRLDVFLSKKIKELTRSQIQKVIEEKRVKINGVIRKPSYMLKVGERIRIEYELQKPEGIQPEDIPIKLFYSDRHIAVVNKPSGMVVHPGAGNRQHTLVNALLFCFPGLEKVGPEGRNGIVHRLDKDTSGLLVIAKTLNALRELQRQFRNREVEKLYLGLVWGRISGKTGRINWPIGRHVKHGERISVKTKKPRDAETHYSVLKNYKEFTLLEIKPVTGRTHQIRVHLAASGHPLVGDPRYGRRKSGVRFPRLFLHAVSLAFAHPDTGEKLEFFSSLPEDLKSFLDRIEKAHFR